MPGSALKKLSISMLGVSSVFCTSAVQEFLQTSRCTIAVNACQVSEAAEGSQGRLLLHIEWPTVANTTVYLLEMDLTSLETDFILPETDFNSPEMDFTSLEMDFTSPKRTSLFSFLKSIFDGWSPFSTAIYKWTWLFQSIVFLTDFTRRKCTMSEIFGRC